MNPQYPPQDPRDPYNKNQRNQNSYPPNQPSFIGQPAYNNQPPYANGIQQPHVPSHDQGNASFPGM